VSFHFTASPDVDDEEVELPEPPPGAVTSLHDRLGAAYAERIEIYHGELAAALGINAAVGEGGVPASRLPSLALTLPALDEEVPAEEEVLVFDEDLFGNLLDLYVCRGWAPVTLIEDKLKAAEAEEVKRRPENGPGAAPLWTPVVGFFAYCRNMLSILVRDELVTIEKLMAQRLLVHLNVTAIGIAGQWGKLNIKRDEQIVQSQDIEDTGHNQVTYTFEAPELAEQMYQGVTEAVRQRFAYEKTLLELESATAAMKSLRRMVSGRNSGPLAHSRPLEVQQLRKWELTVLELTELEAATRDFHKVLRANVFHSYPTALLVLDSLAPGFSKLTLEDTLGETLWQFYDRIDTLARGIDEQKLVTEATLPAAPAGELLWPAVQRHAAPAGGPSRAMVSKAIESLTGDSAYFAVLHEGTLQELIGAGAIDPDSFTAVVAYQHLIEIIDAVERRRLEEKGWRDFWTAFSRMAAAISLAVLFTPAAETAPVLRAAAVAADMALLAHTVSSAVEQLRLLSDQLDEQFAAGGGFSMAALGRLGELRAYSQSLTDNLAFGVLIQLALTFAGAGWVPVKKLLLARGFLTDLETLYGAEEG
jgi:hypothetical protein